MNEEIRLSAQNGKNLDAVALGRLGGLKGGSARAKILSAERRREIAQIAASSRWENHLKKQGPDH